MSEGLISLEQVWNKVLRLGHSSSKEEVCWVRRGGEETGFSLRREGAPGDPGMDAELLCGISPPPDVLRGLRAL